MDYRNLPIEERISKAAEYCLLLADDERADVNIVSEVKTTFFLTDEQAQEAYALMKQKYNSEYKKTLGRKIKLAWIVLFVLVVCVAFYAILGDELGSFFYLLAAFFALSIIGIFFSLGNLYFKKSTLLQNLFSNTGNSSSDKKESKAARIPAFFFFMSLVTFVIMFFHPGVVDPKRLMRLDKLVIAQKVNYESTGGKSPTHYYSFHFRNFENEFRLEDNIYKYGKWKIYRDDFIPGDTLSVQIKQKYAERLSGDKKIYLVNVFVSGKWLIDHMDRNEAIKENDKKGFLICVVGFVLSCIGILVWNKFKN